MGTNCGANQNETLQCHYENRRPRPPRAPRLRARGRRPALRRPAGALIDAVALGLLRRELIETVGMTAARGVLTRFGYAHGWRTARGDEARSFRGRTSASGASPAGGCTRCRGWCASSRSSARRRRAGAASPRRSGTSRTRPSSTCCTSAARTSRCAGRCTGFASGYLSLLQRQARSICVEDALRGQGRRRLPHGRQAARGVGRRHRRQRRATTRSSASSGALAQVTAAAQAGRAASCARRSSELARATADDGRRRAWWRAASRCSRCSSWRGAWRKVDSTVLITGESGVGKERVARLIHDESARAARPFVAVNCAAVPETPARERAVRPRARARSPARRSDRRGPLRGGATAARCFLDEVGEVPPAMQAKLLRVLQEREVRRVGENQSRAVDVRVVAATNRDLAGGGRRGPLPPGPLLPAARDRAARAAAARAARRHPAAGARCCWRRRSSAREAQGDAASRRAAADQLLRYDWPGNVRELENAIERAVALSVGTQIVPEDLPEEVRVAPPAVYAPGGCARSTTSSASTSSRCCAPTAATAPRRRSSSTSAWRRCTASSNSTSARSALRASLRAPGLRRRRASTSSARARGTRRARGWRCRSSA